MKRHIYYFIHIVFLFCIASVSCSSEIMDEEIDYLARKDKTNYSSSHNEVNPVSEEINILIMGNSYSRDAFSYLPFIWEACSLNVRMNIENLHIGGVALNTHYQALTERTASFDADSYTSGGKWINHPQALADSILALRKWDLVIFQEAGATALSYNKMVENITNIKAYISDYISEAVICLMINPAHPTGMSTLGGRTMDEEFEVITDNAWRLMSEGMVDDVIPCGTALHRARHSYLDSIGDYGHFSYEGRHLQEGLPCLIEAYAAAQTIMDIFGIEGTILGNPLRVTQDWAVSKRIPGRHGMVITGNEYDYFVCQQCALYATKHPFTYDNVAVRKAYPNLFPLYGFNLEAHRGFSAEYPENTELAFVEAGKVPYFRGIETDVQITKDNVLVCMHDKTLERTTTGTGKVSDYTYAELMEMDINGGFGWNDIYKGKLKIPTFEQYLEVCSLYNKIPYVELKFLTKEGIKKAINMIHSKGFQDGSFVLISFTKSYLTYASTLCRTPIEFMKNEFTDEDLDELAGMENFVVRPTTKFLTEEFVEKCSDKGLLVECYSIGANDLDNLIHWGVAGGTSETWSKFAEGLPASINEIKP